jgi:heterodisulfide reductase subunit C
MLAADCNLIDYVKKYGYFDASCCMNCGCCTAVCPADVEIIPRTLFRLVILEGKEELLSSKEKVFSCLLCNSCEDNCPSGVKITENIRTLRNYFDKST